ncbi:MAG: hypothetical protein ACRC9R_02550, partial [Enterovibrio sp.]
TIRYSWVSKYLFDTLEEIQDYATEWLWFYPTSRICFWIFFCAHIQSVASLRVNLPILFA